MPRPNPRFPVPRPAGMALAVAVGAVVIRSADVILTVLDARARFHRWVIALDTPEAGFEGMDHVVVVKRGDRRIAGSAKGAIVLGIQDSRIQNDEKRNT